MKIIHPRNTGGIGSWTDEKLLKGAGIGNDPEEISGWEKIAEVVASEDLDYIDFENLDINVDKHYLLIYTLKNPLEESSQYFLYRNADYTAANYYYQYLLADDTTVAANRTNGAVFENLTAGGENAGFMHITRTPDGKISGATMQARYQGSGIQFFFIGLSSENTTLNITSLRILAAVAGAIGEGSLIMLCKARTA